MVNFLRQFISNSAETVPLEILAFITSLISEAIPPLPSFPILISIGVLARIQDYALPAIITIAFFSALSKTGVALFFYKITDKAEDIFIDKYGNYFNIKPGQLENFGAKFGKKPLDYLLITLVRGIPFLSSTLLTVAAGLIKLPLKLFVITAFFGSLIQDSLYLYIGFSGLRGFKNYFKEHGTINTILIGLFIIIIIATLTYLHLHKNKGKVNKQP